MAGELELHLSIEVLDETGIVVHALQFQDAVTISQPANVARNADPGSGWSGVPPDVDLIKPSTLASPSRKWRR